MAGPCIQTFNILQVPTGNLEVFNQVSFCCSCGRYTAVPQCFSSNIIVDPKQDKQNKRVTLEANETLGWHISRKIDGTFETHIPLTASHECVCEVWLRSFVKSLKVSEHCLNAMSRM